MERQTQPYRKKSDHRLRPFIADEEGFMYVEWMISLSLLLFLIPTIYFLSTNMEQDLKEMMDRKRLQMEWIAFYRFAKKEIAKGSHFQYQYPALVFQLPDGMHVKYEQKKRWLVRSVRGRGQSLFKGNTIVLQQVYQSVFVPRGEGVYMEVQLQAWYATAKMHTFFSGNRL